MVFGGVALTSMKSSAVCGVVDFVGISPPRCLGSAPRLLGRVRLLLHLGSSERSCGDVLSGSEGFCRHAFCDSFVELCVLAAYVYHLYLHVRLRYGP
jgi:hypothetical protein